MVAPSWDNNLESSIDPNLLDLLRDLPDHKYGKFIKRSLSVLARIAGENIDRLDWKILTSALEDFEGGFQVFYPYRHIRKITIFGSSRILPDTPEYLLAVEFARKITKLGFMVLTGGGGGIMQAGNEGAGREHSFGLNIQLPFEQYTNKFIANDPKSINFKYFFTRKLFFLKESDGVALFPGGFGTQDEAFETLTLCQTGKYGPVPLVLIDKPGGDYWETWNTNVYEYLSNKNLISRDDCNLYTITDNIEFACATICHFYRIYHSSRYVEKQFVMRLNAELSDSQVEILNQNFGDILLEGEITKSKALPPEIGDETENLPRLVFNFNQKNLGRLYQMINTINKFEILSPQGQHPEWK